MAGKKPLSPKMKKGLLYGGLGALGIVAVVVSTFQTERAAPIRDPERVSLTGNLDTRSVSLEGLNRRLAELETGGANGSAEIRREFLRLENMVSVLTRQLEQERRLNSENLELKAEEIARAQANITNQFLETGSVQPISTDQADRAERLVAQDAARRARDEQRARERFDRDEQRRRERDERQRRESIYKPAEPAPITSVSKGQAAAPAPRIATYTAKRPEPKKAEEAPIIGSNIPDVQIPAGSILSAYLLSGLDAPTGTRAQSQPVPVLLRIKKEAILPNYAWADVADCHLLGSAYGELASERVNIRGETVSCTLRDNTAIEGKVKFFVTGADGKNGVRGTLVNRSGRVLASAAMSALAQGLVSSLDSSSSENVFLGGGGGGGAMQGASKGFDLLAEYYLDLAEQMFPVIELPNDQWIDVVITEMLTIKFKG